MTTQADVQKKYGGKWRDVGDWGGENWSRAPRLDPMAQLVWNDKYGWQDAGQMKRMAKKGEDFSTLKAQMDPDFLKYYMAKPEGTSDPELRAQYGKDWMQHFAGSDFFKQYAQNQLQQNPNSPYAATYGQNWDWGNETAGSAFDPSAYSWYNPGQGMPEVPTQAPGGPPPIVGPGGINPDLSQLGMQSQMGGLQRPSQFNYGGGYGVQGKQPYQYPGGGF